MFVDASALVAILADEEDGDEKQKQIAAASGSVLVSPMVRFEATLALSRAARVRSGSMVIADARELLVEARQIVDEYLKEIGAREIDISPEIGNDALDAAAAFGKTAGRGAKLNFGDCFSYACAKASGVPLLYKGDDFSQTDLA